MKERPILFSGPMVRAILEGRKTITRRVVKGESVNNPVQSIAECAYDVCGPSALNPCEFGFLTAGDHGFETVLCPYGTVGDRIWVRETFRIESVSKQSPRTIPFEDVGIVYAADGASKNIHREYPSNLSRACHNNKPSIHMPRWASRITLEITGVRVERLQEISEADAIAEGVCRIPAGTDEDGFHYDASDYRSSFYSLWTKINGPLSWAANHWVWVVEFRRV